MIDIALTRPQRDFVMSESQFCGFCAGLGSGKSYAGTWRLLLLMLKSKGANGAYFMPSFDLLNLRAIPGMMQALEMIGLQYTFSKSEKIIQIEGHGFIVFRSYDNPVNIVSFEVAHSIVDELDTLPKHKAEIVWRKVSERTRQKIKGVENTISMVSTPDFGMSGFFYEKWGKNPQPGYKLFKAATSSNPYLPPGYIDQLLANYDPILASAYIEGDFVSLSRDKIYHYFNRNDHHTSRALKDSDTHIHIGLDFNIGACVACVAVLDDDGNGLYPVIVEEFSSYDTDAFIIALGRYSGRNITVYPDASGGNRSANAPQSSISAIRNAGFLIKAPAANPAVRDRINAVNSLLSKSKFKINTIACPRLTEALESQGYNAAGEPEKSDKHPSFDDATDSLGYCLNTLFPIRIARNTTPALANPNVHHWNQKR